jgi:hypothetical protein
MWTFFSLNTNFVDFTFSGYNLDVLHVTHIWIVFPKETSYTVFTCVYLLYYAKSHAIILLVIAIKPKLRKFLRSCRVVIVHYKNIAFVSVLYFLRSIVNTKFHNKMEVVLVLSTTS